MWSPFFAKIRIQIIIEISQVDIFLAEIGLHFDKRQKIVFSTAQNSYLISSI